MISKNSRWASLALSALLGALGCGGGPEDEALGTLTEPLDLRLSIAGVRIGSLAADARGLISQNSLPPRIFGSLDRMALLRALGTEALLQDGVIAGTTLKQSEDGRRLLEYAVICALPEGTKAQLDATATSPVFEGRLGLAQGWATGALSTVEQRWLTACLLAHANNFGQPVAISLSGSALPVPSGPPTASARVEEAAFYGNLFDPGGPGMFACMGRDAQATCDDGGFAALLEARVCGRSETCGFRFVGACHSDVAVGNDACSGHPGPYATCGAAAVPRGTPIAVPFEEVITAHLPTDAELTGLFQGQCSNTCEHDPCKIGSQLDPTCESLAADVCALDPYCCSVAWDGWCVHAAESRRESSCSACPHSVCQRGVPLNSTCGTCENKVCLEDPVCCTSSWDALCVAKAQELCGVCD